MRHPKGSVVVSACRGMLRLQLPRCLYGEQKYLYLGLPDTPINRQAAEAKAQVIAADIAFERFDFTLEKYRSSITQDNSPLLGELWEKYTLCKSHQLSQTTLNKDFKRIANHISQFPTQRLREARRIRNHLINTLTPQSARKVLMYLASCCRWAVDEELIRSNPFGSLSVGVRKKGSKINPFTRAERDQIIEAFQSSRYYSHYTPFVQFLFVTGCRTSEAVGLQWKHVSPDLTTITFSEALVEKVRKETKTGTTRKFPVNQQLRALLKQIAPAQPQANDLVFKSPEGLAIDAHNFLNRAWRTVLKTLPIEYRSQYHTRHTFISLCLESGVSITQIAVWVGNSPRTIWQFYAGLVNSVEVPE